MRDRTKAAREALAKEVMANARLIAAAPDMLAALQAAQKVLYHEELVIVSAAIAKATGEPA
jgi:hypothetical protein